MTDGGVDAVIVAVGSTSAVEQGVAALGPGGKCVIIGAPPTGAMLAIDPHALRSQEKALLGCSYGSCNPPVDFPMFIDLYLEGRLDLDGFVSETIGIEGIEEAFERMERGDLSMDGAWFSIGRGELHWRDPASGDFSVVSADDPALDQDNKI